MDKPPQVAYASDRDGSQGNKSMRLYDFGFIIILAGLAAAVALVVASQVS